MSKACIQSAGSPVFKNHLEGVIKWDKLLEEIVERNLCAFVCGSVHDVLMANENVEEYKPRKRKGLY